MTFAFCHACQVNDLDILPQVAFFSIVSSSIVQKVLQLWEYPVLQPGRGFQTCNDANVKRLGIELCLIYVPIEINWR